VICARSKNISLVKNLRVRADRMTVLARLRRMSSNFTAVTYISHLMAPFVVLLRCCLQPRGANLELQRFSRWRLSRPAWEQRVATFKGSDPPSLRTTLDIATKLRRNKSKSSVFAVNKLWIMRPSCSFAWKFVLQFSLLTIQ
jgi:hypothetical protein